MSSNKYKRWLEEEIKILKAEYKRKTNKAIAQMLKRTEDGVAQKLSTLGISQKRNSQKRNKWTTEEIEILKANYKYFTNAKLAQMVGHSEASVSSKKRELGLVKNRTEEVQARNRSSITNTTRTLICGSVVRGESLEQIAKDTQRPIKVIERVLGECRQSGMYKKVEDYIKGVY